MENLVNFLNNFRENTAQWQQDLDRRSNEALSNLGSNLGQAWNTTTTPARAAGRMAGDTLGLVGQGIVNGANSTANGVNQATGGFINNLANSPISNKAIFGTNNNQNQNQVASTTPVANNQNNAGTQYQRDAGIDTFISLLRVAMNPLRGITGETPLDTIANTMSDSLYSQFGKKVEGGSTDTNTTEEKTSDDEQQKETTTADAVLTSTPTEDSEMVTYTYKPGDTFGQVIKNLGLNTSNGLWGNGGDVEYYTRQLLSQGALDSRGNIPTGTTIKLRRRK